MKKQIKFQKELLILPIVLLFIYFRPSFLVNFTSTFLGRLLMLILIILATLKNKWYGISIAILIIIITELGVIEGMNHEDNTETTDPTESSDPSDPTDSIETTDPIETTDSIETTDPIETTDQDDINVKDVSESLGFTNELNNVLDEFTNTDNKEDFTVMKNFGVTGGNERLYIDEKLRARSSNDCLY